MEDSNEWDWEHSRKLDVSKPAKTFVKQQLGKQLMPKGAVTLGNFSCNLSRNVRKPSIAVARTGVLHCAMELPATRKTEEDRGEYNKDPDWLIEQSIARQVAGGVLHCATAIESCCNRCKK